MNLILDRILPLSLLACGLAVGQVQLSGSIKDINGRGIPGATVILQSGSLSAVSDSSGSYVLSGKPGAGLSKSENGINTIPSLTGTGIRFGIKESFAPVRIEIFGVQGSRIETVLDQQVPRGNYFIPYEGLPATTRIRFIVIQVGSRRHALKLSPSAGPSSNSRNSRGNPHPASVALSSLPLLKTAVASDTLCAASPGYARVCRAIDSLRGTQDFVLAKVIRLRTGSPQSAFEQFLTDDFSNYLTRMFTQELDTVDGHSRLDLVVGTARSNPLIAAMIGSGQIKLPVGKNGGQGYAIKTIDKTLYVAASEEAGLANGLYDLLEQYGAYFQLSSDMLPDKREFAVKDLDLLNQPAFKYRGVFPWDNFLAGMSGWNEEDYHDFIDKMVRMKFNLIQFHFYPGFAYYNETYSTGETVKPWWIANPTPDLKTFGLIGQSAFGTAETFGPREWIRNNGNPLKQASECQAMLKRVIDYAHSRGLIVSLGYALMEPLGGTFTNTSKGVESIPLPMDAHNTDLQLERYRRLVSLYPNADVYWLWQSEAGGDRFRQVGAEAGYADMRKAHADWSTVPGYEGDIDYAYVFREVANKLTAEERRKLSTGGWDIQHTFPGFDKDIDKNVVFASLNNAYPTASIPQMDNFAVAKTGRRTWMIDWGEFDGNEWFPQYRVEIQEPMYAKCLQFGVEAVTLLTWKQTGLEQQFRYLTEFTWKPGLTAGQFYRDYAARIYGNEAGQQLAAMYHEFDSIQFKQPRATFGDDRSCNLSNGWAALALPTVPGNAAEAGEKDWRGYVDNAETYKREQGDLRNRNSKWINTLTAFKPKMNGTGEFWGKVMINRLSMQNHYLEAMSHLNSSFQAYDQKIKSGDLAGARSSAGTLMDAALAEMKSSIEIYASLILNTSDKGIVGQMNVQTYDLMENFAGKISGRSAYGTLDWTSFRLLGTSKLAHDFEASPWPSRDGGISTSSVVIENGLPTQKLSLGGSGTAFNSFWIYQEPIDPAKYGYMDFKIRILSKNPEDAVALMFNLEGEDATWYQIDLIGKQNYVQADAVPSGTLQDGNWHRVTWDLEKLISIKLKKPGAKITRMIIGNWGIKAPNPIVIEVQSLMFGKADTNF